jgi:endoglucanase
VRLAVPDRLVYAPHDYAWFHPELKWLGYDGLPLSMKDRLGRQWGYLLRQGERYTAPVWVSEIGTCGTGTDCIRSTGGGSQGHWYESIHRYLAEADIDWAWWAINPTQSSQQPDSYVQASNKRRRGAVETYGLLSADWTIAPPPDPRRALVASLMELRRATEGP